MQLRSRHYDVVLLDIVLPKMSGIDVMESLRRDQPAHPRLHHRRHRPRHPRDPHALPGRARDAVQAGDPEPAAPGRALLLPDAAIDERITHPCAAVHVSRRAARRIFSQRADAALMPRP